MRILVFDVEGTLFQTEIDLSGTDIKSTIWQAIAHELGAEAVKEEIETHKRWKNGGYSSYLDWMRDTIEIHKKYGLDEKTFQRLIKAASYNPGVKQTLTSLNREKYEPILVSGGFRELTRRPQMDFKIRHAFAACEYHFGKDGELKSYNLLPCDFEGKIDFIELMLEEYNLKNSRWFFIGDSRNDVPLAKRADVAIGYRPDLELREVVDYRISDFSELLDILGQFEDES